MVEDQPSAERLAVVLRAVQLAAGCPAETRAVSAEEVSRLHALHSQALVVLVAALNIISGLFMLVKDKGSNIAILRTMGATKGAIMRVFFITGAAIGTFGTFVGLILGLLICANANNIRNAIQWLSGVDPFNAEFYYLAQLPAKVDYQQTFWIVFFALVMSYLATLYPSWKAARLDPVEALRYE